MRVGSSYLHKPRGRRRIPIWFCIALVVVGIAIFWSKREGRQIEVEIPAITSNKPPVPKAGDIVSKDSVQAFNAAQATTIARENYRGATLPVTAGVTKITFQYRSELPDGQLINVYARAYLPEAPAKNLPIFAFATGTTGIGDKCAPSLEQPHISDWANYDSHMTMYASQGYATVLTDYEGMRDPSRIHHYMVGELEGRAVLDSIRALKRLPESSGRLNDSTVFLGGYSQGGHAAFWADKIASSYAPEIKPKGVVGYGPVMSVKQTLVDVTHAANINWFGPYVVYSYQDYYNAKYGPVLLPHWEQTLASDVPAHCIDTVLPFWGYSPANVYTPEFIQAMSSGNLSEQYLGLERDLARNEVGAVNTPSAKRINQGENDNVVLTSQQHIILPELCHSSSGPVELVVYPKATHYTTMVRSLVDTLGWMRALSAGQSVANTCG